MSKISIRPYSSSDCGQLVELFRRSVRELGLRDYSVLQVQAWAPEHIDVKAFCARRADHPTWVAEVDGKLSGFSDLESDGHIDMLYVHPDYARIGVASALLQLVQVEAEAIHLKRLYTEASIGARPVFERFGFRVLASQIVWTGGQSFTNYRMEKTIGHSSVH